MIDVGRLRHFADFVEDHGIGVGDHSDAPFIREVAAEVERLSLELSGERKAKELAIAGLASVTELYDTQKHEVRALRERVKALEEALKPFAEYDYADHELKHIPQPERDKLTVGYGHNAPTYGDCRRALALLSEAAPS